MSSAADQQSSAEPPAVPDAGAAATGDGKSWEWRIIGETIAGASHVRDGRPNQDAILQLRESGLYPPIIVALSDGHGSNKCFRSHRGSRFAVTLGTQLLHQSVNEKWQGCELSELEKLARESLPAEFVRQWQAAVRDDLARQPFSEEELAQVAAKDGERARELVSSHPALAYGATALLVAVTQSYVLYAQLGDGEMLAISESGELSRPLPEDQRLLANETTSLCTETAAADFRIACQPLQQFLPALVIMTTDGYANSFADDAGFLQVGSDLLAMLRGEGFDVVSRSLKGWLEEATRLGSGDDCTLGLICRMDALQMAAPAPASAGIETAAPPAVAQETETEKLDDKRRPSAEKS